MTTTLEDVRARHRTVDPHIKDLIAHNSWSRAATDAHADRAFLLNAIDRYESKAPSKKQVEQALELTELTLGIPWTFGYRYPDGVRFDTNGRTINANRPSETWPLYSLNQINDALRATSIPSRDAVLEEELNWRTDAYGGERRSLFIAGLHIGSVMEVKAGGPWRAWLMTDDEGERVGKDTWPTEEAAKDALMKAAIAVLAAPVDGDNDDLVLTPRHIKSIYAAVEAATIAIMNAQRAKHSLPPLSTFPESELVRFRPLARAALKAAFPILRDETIHEQAVANVEAVRGSSDVPGFDACMKAEEAQLLRDAVLEEAAKIAENCCLVPPDGGCPTDSEREMCNHIASVIRAHKAPTIDKLKEGE